MTRGRAAAYSLQTTATSTRRAKWGGMRDCDGGFAPAAAVGVLGALSALPVLAGCAGVETAAAADATLERFTSCAALTAYARTHALEDVGPYGLGRRHGRARIPQRVRHGRHGRAFRRPRRRRRPPGVDFSATNVQEAGVDEPDIVKTDGNRIFALAKNRLYAVDVSGPTPRIAGSLAMPKDALRTGHARLRQPPARHGRRAGRRSPDAGRDGRADGEDRPGRRRAADPPGTRRVGAHRDRRDRHRGDARRGDDGDRGPVRQRPAHRVDRTRGRRRRGADRHRVHLPGRAGRGSGAGRGRRQPQRRGPHHGGRLAAAILGDVGGGTHARRGRWWHATR